MQESLKKHLPAIAAIGIIGFLTGAFILSIVHDNAASLSVGAFSMYTFLIPCALMLLCSFAMAMTANEINHQLFVTVLAICVVAGVISVLVVSSWMEDPELAAKLLSNSGEGAHIVPITQSPLLIIRDFAAFVVCPVVGCIAGAWVGSRLHPMKAAPGKKASKGKK